jgi:hypothetical protein
MVGKAKSTYTPLLIWDVISIDILLRSFNLEPDTRIFPDFAKCQIMYTLFCFLHCNHIYIYTTCGIMCFSCCVCY